MFIVWKHREREEPYGMALSAVLSASERVPGVGPRRRCVKVLATIHEVDRRDPEACAGFWADVDHWLTDLVEDETERAELAEQVANVVPRPAPTHYAEGDDATRLRYDGTQASNFHRAARGVVVETRGQVNRPNHDAPSPFLEQTMTFETELEELDRLEHQLAEADRREAERQAKLAEVRQRKAAIETEKRRHAEQTEYEARLQAFETAKEHLAKLDDELSRRMAAVAELVAERHFARGEALVTHDRLKRYGQTMTNRREAPYFNSPNTRAVIERGALDAQREIDRATRR
ncbi:MAG: hypothetical protein AB7S38_18350 [Vulcanimicrobiota bacterium]